MYVCMYVCIYVCMYVCMYLCMYVCIYVCVYVRTCVRMYDHRYVPTYLFMYVCLALDVSTMRQACRQSLEVGRCTEIQERYYYNVTNDQCEMFQYGGCDGNLNRFESFEECKATCQTGQFPILFNILICFCDYWN